MTGAQHSAADRLHGHSDVSDATPDLQEILVSRLLLTFPAADYTYQILKCISDGEYLLRIQSLAIHNPGGTPQFYISCAQVKVTGGGSATPSPTAKIPGAFKATDPGYTANVSCTSNAFSLCAV